MKSTVTRLHPCAVRLVLRMLRMTLWIALGVGTLPSPVLAQSNGVLRQVYTGISGTAVADLTNSLSFPDNPTSEEVLTNGFEAPTNIGDSYGQRLTAYLVPPASGNYVFWIASDDNSVLYVSADDQPANKQQIASVPMWTNPRQWNKFVEQQSAPVTLTAGQRCYIEALMKEANGGDNLAVRWQLPDGTIEEPIPNNRLRVFGVGLPQISQQPNSVTVIEGGTATFNVQIVRAVGATYQWQRGGTDIPGATRAAYSFGPVATNDNGAQFRCRITNPAGVTNSSPATLTVPPDTTRPTITSVANLGDAQILSVVFSEPVEAASAANPSNYSINGGIGTPVSARLGADAQTIVLTTAPLSPDATYTLTVNNVRDRAATPNTILPGSQKTFSLDFTPLDPGTVFGAPETPGPSSRRTGLVISEIMFHPTNRPDGRNLEFVELYNSQPFFQDISGCRITGTFDYTFPSNTTLAARSYLVVAPSPADVQSVYGIANVFGGFTNNLSNGSGTVRLCSRYGAILLEVPYSGDPPWPVAADGAGHSLVLARPSYGEGNPKAWAASDLAGGTPGTAETPGANPYRTVVINEFLAHTDDPDVDYIELFNYSAQAVNLAGCVLTDDPDTNRFIIPNGVSIPARGFLVYFQTDLGFALNAAGETICFKNPAGTKVLDAVRFKGQENGVATGRYPDGGPEFHRLISKTPGARNAKIRVGDVVLNEIMYNPISGNSDDEYVELLNRAGSPLNLGGWKLSGAVSYTFPSNAVIPAKGCLVVAKQAARLMANYPQLNITNTLGDFGGTLANSGERVALTMPDTAVNYATNGSVVTATTNLIHITMDEVTYGDSGRWGQWSDGGGSSLELMDPRSDHRQAPNWADSDESAKSPWVTVQATGVLDNGNGTADSLQLFLQGAGECLVDNVEVFAQAGQNLVANSTFESGLTGWFPQGTHDLSSLDDTSGFGGGKCLHLRASSRGDTGANRVRVSLTSALSAGATATLRAKVRWLKGDPEILLRLHGNWLEAFTNIVAAANLGTPGQPNSRAITNTGPAIFNVAHGPVVPAAGQAVTIRAQVNDPDGLASLVLKYRLDPATDYTSVGMTHRGAGFYSATLPGQSSGTLAAFYIEAADNASPAAVTRFPADALARECLIRFGETAPGGALGTYRLWITSATETRWRTREKNSNEPLDATFAYNNDRVAYNVAALYSGSPWRTTSYNGPLGIICDYVVTFPSDDPMLGADDFVLASLGNAGNDATGQREQTAFWMLEQLGAPTLNRRHVNLFVNGIRRGMVYEDAQQPSGDIVSEWFPDDTGGTLHKLDDWFEFDDTGDTHQLNVNATLGNFTTSGGAKKTARYRWNWRRRAVGDSANNYTNLFALVDAVNAARPEPYTARTETLVDVEEWMRVIALEHIVGNWDSYGYNRGKNMYAYKPENGKWNLLAWDIDSVLGLGDGTATEINPSSSQFGVNDGVLRTFLAFPPFQRAFWRALEDAVNGPMEGAAVSALMNAKYSALVAAGIPVSDPGAVLAWINSRRSCIQTQLVTVAAPFAIVSNGGGNFSTNRNYLTLTGTAPISVKTIEVNGLSCPLTWTSVTNWTMTLVLNPGVNTLTILGRDLRRSAVAGATASIAINYTGVADPPQDHLVINEIMYNAALPNAAFIELHNTSTNNAFDLSGWRLDGAAFTFPGGSVILPGGFLVVAGDAQGFQSAYGGVIPLAGVFGGTLQNNGETLKLVRPGAPDTAIDEVTYDSAPPWPAAANGFGPSLQLMDLAQDNNRVANWAAVTRLLVTNAQRAIVITNVWQYEQSGADLGTAWRAAGYNDSAWPSGRALLYKETSALPAPIHTPLALGPITYYFRAHFNFTGNPTNAVLTLKTVWDDGAVVYLNGVEVFRLGMPADTISSTTPANRLVDNAVYEGPFAVPATGLVMGDNVVAVEVHQNNADSSDIVFGMTLDVTSVSDGRYTPGQPNSVKAPLAPFPLVWLNEIQPNNLTGPQDNFGDRDPWVELYNSGTNAVDLSSYYLSDNYTNLLRWAFPGGTTLAPGQFRLVWLDNEPGETGGANLHAGFHASPTNGSVVLTRISSSTTNIVDYLNYPPLNGDRSYGASPDGTPARRQVFYHATPGATNDNSWPAALVTINEWLAGNTGTLRDPATGNFDDWFELHNAAPTPLDLTGYTLTDDLTWKTQFTIPPGYCVPANGYLLVWADNDSSRNNTNEPQLHVNFALSKGGEAIGLFTPAGVAVDTVTFGPQTNDVSQGRWPDGNSGQYYFMTTPTPGAANRLGTVTNLPPVLAGIPNQTVYQGSPLSLVAAATDPNPGQTLAYSLDPGAPATAYINPISGVFSWTPTPDDFVGDHILTVRVTDDGSPPLSDSQPVKVTVLSPPTLELTSITPNPDGSVTFAWATQPQRTYRISYKTDLTQPAWIFLTDLTATSTQLSITDDASTDSQRFYRIELLP